MEQESKSGPIGKPDRIEKPDNSIIGLIGQGAVFVETLDANDETKVSALIRNKDKESLAFFGGIWSCKRVFRSDEEIKELIKAGANIEIIPEDDRL